MRDAECPSVSKDDTIRRELARNPECAIFPGYVIRVVNGSTQGHQMLAEFHSSSRVQPLGGRSAVVCQHPQRFLEQKTSHDP